MGKAVPWEGKKQMDSAGFWLQAWFEILWGEVNVLFSTFLGGAGLSVQRPEKSLSHSLLDSFSFNRLIQRDRWTQ